MGFLPARVAALDMVGVETGVRLAGYGLGALGSVLLFGEFFQVPSYIEFDQDLEFYNVDISPDDVSEYSWAGRIGAICLALAFALQFLAVFL